MTIHVVDEVGLYCADAAPCRPLGRRHAPRRRRRAQNPHSLARGGGLEDVNLVKKYVMTEDEYDKRPGTLREFKKKKLAEDPNFRFFPNVRLCPHQACLPRAAPDRQCLPPHRG